AIEEGNKKDMIEGTDIEGVARLYAFKKLTNEMGAGYLYLSVGIPKKTVLASVNRMVFRTHLIIGMIALLMIVTALTGINKFILVRFNSLLSTTKELAQGNMTARTNIPYDSGELGELAESFDIMAATIENREQELRHAYSDLDQIFQATADGLCVIDKDFRIKRINRSFTRITEQDAGELVGRKCYEVLRKPICNTPNCMMAQILGGKREVEYDLDKILKDGTAVSHIITATPYCDTEGNIIGVLEHLKDVTERKKFEAEMVRYECLNLVGEMGAGIGHEIRNPLTTVRGLLQLLGNKKRYNDHLHYFDLMISEIDRINSILMEFLALTKSKPTELKKQNLNSIVEILFPLIKSDAKIAGKEIKLDLGPIPDVPLDDKQMRQLILNLVRNGLEAMPKGGKLTIMTYVDENVVLEVNDQGCGIDRESLAKLGTPFFTTKEKGTGLGLAISYNIAENHDATIEVKSDENGTSFYVRFGLPD
ncbi:MAG TPA: ATP-binding protein, partial [Clostridia bacterium]|nr:ATP-binding protein [Clostridia bacterium]